MVEFRFEKLEAWQLAIAFCDDVYRITRRFPDNERFGLTSQMRRAAVSIPAHIAEGSGRISDRDNLRYLEIAYGSLMEIVSHTEISRRQQFIDSSIYEDLRQSADKLSRLLSDLSKYLRRSPRP